jgi:dTDP-4-dehydrorhamnose 3,5-epimerase
LRFQPTEIDGVFFIELDALADERGMFARTFCEEAFAKAGVEMRIAQANISRNPKAGTLRGLHFQAPPFAEGKLVRAVRGAIHDVVVDLRPESPAYRRWTAATLSAENGEALLIPTGCAHGFLTLEDETDVLYQMDRLYTPGHARGVRYDDPALDIAWPAAPRVIGPPDLGWPLLEG